MQCHLNIASEIFSGLDPVKHVCRTTARTGKKRVVREVGKLLREHLSFSLDKVFTSDEQTPVLPDSDAIPDIWVAKLSKNPVVSRSVIEPCLVIEIQPSTHKVATFLNRIRGYRAIESLREILVIDQSNRLIEVYRRNSSGSWIVEDTGMQSSIYLETIYLEVPVEMFWLSGKSVQSILRPCREMASFEGMKS